VARDPGCESEGGVGRTLSCPGRGVAFFMPLRRAGTVPNTALCTAPALQRTAPQVLRAALRPGHGMLRRRLFARLVDRDVLAVRDRGAAVGDDKRIEFDEAVPLLFVVAGDFCPRG
jgi:hypothetical protein